MDSRPKLPRDMVGRSIRVSEKPDHLKVTFRYMTPLMRRILSFALRPLRVLMILCFLGDLIGAFVSASQYGGPYHTSFLAEDYLGSIYTIYFSLTHLYVSLLVDWVGFPKIVFIVVPLAAIASIITWMKIIDLTDRLDVLPRILAPVLSFRKTLRFYPQYLKIGVQKVPLDKEASAFRLDQPKRLRDGQNASRHYYGAQEIIYDVYASKYPVAVFWNADRATNVQNGLSVALAWWKDNLDPSSPDVPSSRDQVVNQDIAVD